MEKIRVNPICLKGALLTAVMTPKSIATKLTKFQKKNKFVFSQSLWVIWKVQAENDPTPLTRDAFERVNRNTIFVDLL